LKQTIDWYAEQRDWWQAGKTVVEAAYAKQGQ